MASGLEGRAIVHGLDGGLDTEGMLNIMLVVSVHLYSSSCFCKAVNVHNNKRMCRTKLSAMSVQGQGHTGRSKVK